MKAVKKNKEIKIELDPGTYLVDNTAEGDIIYTEDETGKTYVFRGLKLFEVVDGKEVLIKDDSPEEVDDETV